MRRRTVLIPMAALGMSVFLAVGLAAAQPQGSARVADTSAALARTFYVSGSMVTASGSPMSLAGLASLTVTTTGQYTGTLVLAGPKPATLQVSGSISGSNMTLATMVGSQPLSVTAHAVTDRLGDRGKDSPMTTAGNEFQGAAMLGATTTGWITVIDASIMRQYGFAATVTSGPDRDAIINGTLVLLADRYGDLHGYLLRDPDGTLFPLRSGALNRGQLVIHLDLMNDGQVVGAAMQSRSTLAHQLIFKGNFGGPRPGDVGTWFSAPPD